MDDLLDHGDRRNNRRSGDAAATLGEGCGGEHGGEHRGAHPQNCAMERHDTPYSSTIAPIRRHDVCWNEPLHGFSRRPSSVRPYRTGWTGRARTGEDVGRDHRRDGVRIIRRKVRGRGRRLHPPRTAVALSRPRQGTVWRRYDLEAAIAGRHPIRREIRWPERGATRIRHDHRRRPINDRRVHNIGPVESVLPLDHGPGDVDSVFENRHVRAARNDNIKGRAERARGEALTASNTAA